MLLFLTFPLCKMICLNFTEHFIEYECLFMQYASRSL